MKIICINDDTLNVGHSECHNYLRAALCGPGLGVDYGIAMARGGGVASIPGIINALIEEGLRDRKVLTRAAARISRCRDRTVGQLIDAMTGPDTSQHLWADRDGYLGFHDEPGGGESPRILIAA